MYSKHCPLRISCSSISNILRSRVTTRKKTSNQYLLEKSHQQKAIILPKAIEKAWIQYLFKKIKIKKKKNNQQKADIRLPRARKSCKSILFHMNFKKTTSKKQRLYQKQEKFQINPFFKRNFQMFEKKVGFEVFGCKCIFIYIYIYVFLLSCSWLVICTVLRSSIVMKMNNCHARGLLYIYIYICVCVCVCVRVHLNYAFISKLKPSWSGTIFSFSKIHL